MYKQLYMHFFILFYVYSTRNTCTSNCTHVSYVLFSFWLWKSVIYTPPPIPEIPVGFWLDSRILGGFRVNSE